MGSKGCTELLKCKYLILFAKDLQFFFKKQTKTKENCNTGIDEFVNLSF